MTETGNLMVFIEQNDNVLADVSLELLSRARELADRLGVEVEGLAVGHGLQDALAGLGGYGCDRVYFVEDPRLAHFTSLPYAKALVGIIKKRKPRFMLFGATTTGRDVAPRVASTLQCGLTADCTDLQIGEHKFKKREYRDILLQIRPAFGGNIIATIVSPESSPSLATVREGVMQKRELADPHPCHIVHEPCRLEAGDFPTQVLEVIRREKSVDLKAAKVIVSAGMGASSPESLKLVKELAGLLGGEVGSSRPMVDGGFLVKDHQVGQTGTTVRPNLYIACGISGQIQHRAGMSEAKRIIAINRDPEAPIFDIAHYAVVGEVNEVLKRMIKAYKQKNE
ncbi:MAG: electron transfer flavoprotein subunit alpha/FixB family protein [Desulfohalobiaceae bacterium]|nr:electron transfer flavoprotein subunit alpha/FixB family protein [Desulfohalobiaceae bacterium]